VAKCPHEKDLRKQGWKPEIRLIVYAKAGQEERTIHYHGPESVLDLAAIIGYLSDRIASNEEARKKRSFRVQK